MCNLYACLILIIQLWGTKTDTVLFLSSLMLEKVENFLNFVAGVTLFLYVY